MAQFIEREFLVALHSIGTRSHIIAYAGIPVADTRLDQSFIGSGSETVMVAMG